MKFRSARPEGRRFPIYFFLFLIGAILLIEMTIRCRREWNKPTVIKTESVHHMVVQQIERMGRLELVRYKLKDVVEETIARPWYMGGDTRVLVVVSGEAAGCLDLRLIKESDITETDSGRLVVRLPEPMMCYSKVNHSESHVYDTRANPFYGSAEALDAAYKQAERKIAEAAMQSGLMAETKENAQRILVPLLETMTKKQVTLTFGLNDSAARR